MEGSVGLPEITTPSRPSGVCCTIAALVSRIALWRSPATTIACARMPCSQSRRCIARAAAVASSIRSVLSDLVAVAFSVPLTAWATAPGKAASGAVSTAADCKKDRRFTGLPLNLFFFRGAVFQSEYLLRRTLKIALETTILCNVEGLVLLFRQFFSHLVRDPARIHEHIVLIELQEGIELLNPFRHAHRNLPRGLVFGIVQIHADNPFQRLDLPLFQIVLRNGDIRFLNAAARGVFPRFEPHIRLAGLGALRNQLGSGLAGDRPMQLVLNRLEENLRNLRVLVVVDAALLEDVRDLKIKAPFAGANGANPLQQLIKVILAETLALFEAFIVEHEALDEVLAQNLSGPYAELRRLAAVDPISDGDDGVQIVKVHLAGNRPNALSLNYPVFPD